MTREEILSEVRRTAQENGGTPLGRDRFLRITGITEYELGRHWARYGDAVRDAGLEPNKLNLAYDERHLIEKYLALVRRLGHVPTSREMRLERSAIDPSFPTPDVYRRFGGKNDLIGRVLDYARETAEHADVVPILEAAYVSGDTRDAQTARSTGSGTTYGFVYLVRGHVGEYKVGRTTLVDRRLAELGATSSVEQALVHEIKTDDPVGVEAYWHGRFAEKRMRGEWFRLNAADVRAFKRWRRIF